MRGKERRETWILVRHTNKSIFCVFFSSLFLLFRRGKGHTASAPHYSNGTSGKK